MQPYWNFRAIFDILTFPNDIQCRGKTRGGEPCTNIVQINEWLDANELLNQMDRCNAFPTAETLAKLSSLLICDCVLDTYEGGHYSNEAYVLCLKWLRQASSSGHALGAQFDDTLIKLPTVMAMMRRSYEDLKSKSSKSTKGPETVAEALYFKPYLLSQTSLSHVESAISSHDETRPLNIPDTTTAVKNDEALQVHKSRPVEATSRHTSDTPNSGKRIGLGLPAESRSGTQRVAESSAQDETTSALESEVKWQRIPLLHLLGQLSEEDKSWNGKHGIDNATLLSERSGMPGSKLPNGKGFRTTKTPMFPSSLETKRFATQKWAKVSFFPNSSASRLNSASTPISDFQSSTTSSFPAITSLSTKENSIIPRGVSTRSKATTSFSHGESTTASKPAIPVGPAPTMTVSNPQIAVTDTKSQEKRIGPMKLPVGRLQMEGGVRWLPSTQKNKEISEIFSSLLPLVSMPTPQETAHLRDTGGESGNKLRQYDVDEQLPLTLFDTMSQSIRGPDSTPTTSEHAHPSSAEELAPPVEFNKLNLEARQSNFSKPSPRSSSSDPSELSARLNDELQDDSGVGFSMTSKNLKQLEVVDSPQNPSMQQVQLETSSDLFMRISQVSQDRKLEVNEITTHSNKSPEKDGLPVALAVRMVTLGRAIVSPHLSTQSITAADTEDISLKQPVEVVKMPNRGRVGQFDEALRTESKLALLSSAVLPDSRDTSPKPPIMVANTEEALAFSGDQSGTVQAPRSMTPIHLAPISRLRTPIKNVFSSNMTTSATIIPIRRSENKETYSQCPQVPSSHGLPSPLDFVNTISPPTTYRVPLQIPKQHDLPTPPSSPEKQRHIRVVSTESMLSATSCLTTTFLNLSNNRPASSNSSLSLSRTPIIRKPVPVLGSTEGKGFEISGLGKETETVASAARIPIEPVNATWTRCAVCGRHQLFESWGCKCDGPLDEDKQAQEPESEGGEAMDAKATVVERRGRRSRLGKKALVSRLRNKVGKKVVAVGRRVSGEI